MPLILDGGGGWAVTEGDRGRGLASITPPKFEDLPAGSDSTLGKLRA